VSTWGWSKNTREINVSMLVRDSSTRGRYSPHKENGDTLSTLSHTSEVGGACRQSENCAMLAAIAERLCMVRILGRRGYHIKKTP